MTIADTENSAQLSKTTEEQIGWIYNHIKRDFDQKIAEVAHEVNRAYCEALCEEPQPSWDKAPDWQRSSAIDGVAYHRANPHGGAECSHENWLKEKVESGWKWGPVKDPDLKEHPCMVPFHRLPMEQQAKDFIFRAIVQTLISQSS